MPTTPAAKTAVQAAALLPLGAVIDATLTQYLTTYNHHIPQRALNHQCPIQALKRWQIDRPDLFTKRVYKQTGFDM